MGKLTTIALIIVASVTTGCSTCMQSGYYDPCGGVCYGPSVKAPTFLSGRKKQKHDEHSCPLCNAEAPTTPPGIPAGNGGVNGCCQHEHGSTWSATTNYGAAFGQPVSAQGSHSPNCACPSPQNCSSGCSAHKRSQACRGKGQPHCNCSAPATNCNVCDPCPNPCPISNCDACSTIGNGYSTVDNSYSGVVYDEPFVTNSYSSDPMILPGETIIDGEMIHGNTIHPETFSSGNCPHCQSTSGPIFNGTIIPGHEHQQTPPYETDKPTGPQPAPAADPTTEAVPGETVSPMPEPGPLPASAMMMIPTFPAPKPARQVHWVPNALK
jgi:hypothetical protein